MVAPLLLGPLLAGTVSPCIYYLLILIMTSEELLLSLSMNQAQSGYYSIHSSKFHEHEKGGASALLATVECTLSRAASPAGPHAVSG